MRNPVAPAATLLEKICNVRVGRRHWEGVAGILQTLNDLDFDMTAGCFVQPDQQQITSLLNRASQGDAAASAELIPLVYEELRALAAQYLRNERRDHTLQATALAHEAYLRLVGGENLIWQSRAYFFAAAAQAIRRILVDYARQHQSLKRGGDHERVELDHIQVVVNAPDLDVLAIDEALTRLATFDAQGAKIVELRFFGGLPVEEVAQVMGVSERTIAREWRLARAWLKRELGATAG